MNKIIKEHAQSIDLAQYKKYLSSAVLYSRDRIGSEDILHDSFEGLLKSSSTADFVEAYVGTTIKNKAKKYFAKNRPYMTSKEICDEYDMTDCIEYHSDSYLLVNSLASLPPVQSKVITMFLDDVKMKDIALQLNLSYNTVKATYRQATINLRNYLLKEGFEIKPQSKRFN